uniref:Uncharacterized protein n=1 Tax=Accipiter nisus TaxID=211598 RepID=A0A8B9MLW7_9AVES
MEPTVTTCLLPQMTLGWHPWGTSELQCPGEMCWCPVQTSPRGVVMETGEPCPTLHPAHPGCSCRCISFNTSYHIWRGTMG